MENDFIEGFKGILKECQNEADAKYIMSLIEKTKNAKTVKELLETHIQMMESYTELINRHITNMQIAIITLQKINFDLVNKIDEQYKEGNINDIGYNALMQAVDKYKKEGR